MFGTELLNARQMADELGISYTYFFKLIKSGCRTTNSQSKAGNIICQQKLNNC